MLLEYVNAVFEHSDEKGEAEQDALLPSEQRELEVVNDTTEPCAVGNEQDEMCRMRPSVMRNWVLETGPSILLMLNISGQMFIYDVGSTCLHMILMRGLR